MTRRSILCLPLLMAATPALAETHSTYGCAGLEESSPTSYIEGQNGVFFRLGLDLRTSHPVSEGSIDLMARLSEALATRGTTLVYVPLPSKAQAMPGALPAEAAAYGYDPELAAATYEDAVSRLRAAGVVTVDAMTPLLGLPEGELAFIPTDHHWTSAGARAVAEEVGRTIQETPGYADLDHASVETRSLGVEDLPSPVRREIQALCRETIPPSATEAFETEVTAPAAGNGIFAVASEGPPIVLAGTSMSRTDAFNFDGFLAEAAGLEVSNHAVTGGNQFGAIVSYMLSQEFQDAPARYLVWENPIYNNLAEFGEIPLRELIAAADDQCTPLAVSHPDPSTLLAEVPDGALPAQAFVRADAGDANGRAIRVDFVTADQGRISAMIERSQRLGPTQRFYQYMEPFWEPGITRVEVRFDHPVSEGASLAICLEKETAS